MINLLVAVLYRVVFNANVLLVFSLSLLLNRGVWGEMSAELTEDSTEACGPTLALWSLLGILWPVTMWKQYM